MISPTEPDTLPTPPLQQPEPKAPFGYRSNRTDQPYPPRTIKNPQYLGTGHTELASDPIRKPRQSPNNVQLIPHTPKWSRKKNKAVALIAADHLQLTEIGRELGLSVVTIKGWLKEPDFQAKVKAQKVEIAKRILSRGVAVQTERIAVMDKVFQGLQTVIAERAGDAVMQEVPGGKTGLLSHTQKGVGQGIAARVIDVFEVDTGLIQELRAIGQDVGRELGQIVSKSEHTIWDGDASTLTDEQLARLRGDFEAAVGDASLLEVERRRVMVEAGVIEAEFEEVVERPALLVD